MALHTAYEGAVGCLVYRGLRQIVFQGHHVLPAPLLTHLILCLGLPTHTVWLAVTLVSLSTSIPSLRISYDSTVFSSPI